MRRRVATSAALLLMVMGLSCWSAPALAGDADDSGNLTAAFYNVTPYTMTLVATYSEHGFNTLPATIPAGGGSGYQMVGSPIESGGICFGTWRNSYNGYITYRVDVLGGPPEYLTLAISGRRSYSLAGCGDFAAPGNVYPTVTNWNTRTPPPPNWTPASGTLWTLPNLHPQTTATYNTPSLFDQTIGIAGDWSADARTPLGRGLDEALNQICGQQPDNCDFTQTGPLTWGIGAPTPRGQDVNCPSSAKGDAYFEIAYGATTSASLSVGAGVEASTEAKLFGIIGSKISVSVEAEHEWKETNSFQRKAKVYLRRGYTGAIWTAPTIGTVTGTMKLRTGSSTFTLTNFRQVRSGVTRDELTPAYDAIVVARKARPPEVTRFCGTRSAPGITGGSADVHAVPTLVPGRGVGKLRLGRLRNTAVLGMPEIKAPRSNRNTTANDCTALDPQCAMVAGRGGTWAYHDTTAVFGADRRVSALIYTGPARTVDGIGVGSTLEAVRRAHPGASCLSYPGMTNCAVRGQDRSGPVQTVFHLTRKKGRAVVDRVMIYRVDTSREGWGA